MKGKAGPKPELDNDEKPQEAQAAPTTKPPKRSTRILPVPLTELESNSHRVDLQASIQRLIEAEESLKEISAPLRETIKECKKEAAAISRLLKMGIKHESVICETRYDFAANSKTVVRMDTETVVETLPLDYLDRQMELTDAEATNDEPLPFLDDSLTESKVTH